MRTATALALLLLAPLALLAPCLRPGYALWPQATTLLDPWSLELSAEQRAELEQRAVGSQLDKVIQHHVYNRAVRASLDRGEFPWWHPHAVGGIPLLGTVLPGVLYPLHWPFFLLADEYAWYGWHLALHLAIAAIGTWLLLRRLGASQAPALCAALIFAFSGWMAARAHFHMLVSAAAWAPWMLWAVEGLVREFRWRDAAALALSTGLSLLAGFPGVTLIALQIAALLALARLAARARREGARPAARAGIAIFLGVLAGFAIAAPQIVSGLEYSRRWAREKIDPASWEALALEAPQLETLLRPEAFADVRGTAMHPREARPAAPHLHRLRWLSVAHEAGSRSASGEPLPGTQVRGSYADSIAEMTCYLGMLPLLLLLSVVCIGAHRSALFYLALASLGLAIAYGQPLVLHAFRWLPGAPELGPPVRYLFAFALAFPVFAGLQLERWLRASPSTTRRAATVALCSCAVLLLACFSFAQRDPAALGREIYAEGLSQRAHELASAESAREFLARVADTDYAAAAERLLGGTKRAAFAALCAAVALLLASGARRSLLAGLPVLVATVDLGAFFNAWTPPSPRHERVEDHAVLRALRERADDDAARCPRIARIGTFAETGERADGMFITNLPSGAGVSDIQGYMVPDKRWEELLDRLEPGTRRFGSGAWAPASLEALRDPLLDRLAVRFALVPRAMPPNLDGALADQSWRRLDARLDPAFGAEAFTVLENEAAFPEAWFAREGVVVDAPRAGLELFADPQFDAARCAVLEHPIEGVSTVDATAARSAAPSAPRPARVTYRSPQRLELEIELAAGETGLLVIAETWAPGWSAEVDDHAEAREVVRVNHAMRAVRLEGAGVHRVRLKYVETWPKLLLAPAALLGLLALVVLVASVLFSRSRAEVPA